jgi:hypothetical protein
MSYAGSSAAAEGAIHQPYLGPFAVSPCYRVYTWPDISRITPGGSRITPGESHINLVNAVSPLHMHVTWLQPRRQQQSPAVTMAMHQL